MLQRLCAESLENGYRRPSLCISFFTLSVATLAVNAGAVGFVTFEFAHGILSEPG